jgi:hypothetical protein
MQYIFLRFRHRVKTLMLDGLIGGLESYPFQIMIDLILLEGYIVKIKESEPHRHAAPVFHYEIRKYSIFRYRYLVVLESIVTFLYHCINATEDFCCLNISLPVKFKQYRASKR